MRFFTLDGWRDLQDDFVTDPADDYTGRLRMDLEVLGPDGERAPFTPQYEDLAGFSLASDPEQRLPGPHGLGDLGYDEIDTPAPGVFEHRMLFSGGVELSVRFRAFTFAPAASPGVS